MSDEERDYSEEEGEEEEEQTQDEPVTPTQKSAPADSGPSEAELAMQKRRQAQMSSTGLDETAIELLEANRAEREEMEAEIREMRERSARRKKEREEEERRVMEERAVEEARRKEEEDERRRKKEEDELQRREARAAKMAEFEKWKNPSTPNFVITKKASSSIPSGDDEGELKDDRKSREQLEAEKKAIMAQRIQPLAMDGMDESKLVEKAKELHKLIFRLEGEKYDLEKRYKEQQYDMMELAERARQMNKVGKGGLKRVMLGADERDTLQERFAGAPAKIEMYSTFEMQKDKRDYGTRRNLFTGPQYRYPADKIQPYREVKWNEQGLLEYQDMEGVERPPETNEEGEEGEEQAVEE